jgi:hypothetical protein
MGKNAACAVGQVPFTFVAMWDILYEGISKYPMAPLRRPKVKGKHEPRASALL